MKRLYNLLTFLSIHYCSSAAIVTSDIAKTVALNFYTAAAGPSSSLTASLNYTKTESDGTIDFYVFDISPAPGFVIVSASDNVTPILGYSTESNFDPSLSLVGICGWIKSAAIHVHHAVVNNLPASQSSANLWSAYRTGSYISNALRGGSVSPMLSSTWSQCPLYNTMCPYDSTNRGQSVTGCEATAMAQIMRFWSYPAQGAGSYSYVDSADMPGYSYNIGRLSADFGATTYQWSQMPLSLTDRNTDVAQLLFHCGVSMATSYSALGSSAYSQNPGYPCAVHSFTTYFGYDSSSIQFVQQANYTTSDWLTMIENELNQGRPVLYSGRDTGGIGGHAWVCDGYDASGNLHMNWGWGGMDNGYFLSTDLDPNPDNWSWSQAAIIGIKPSSASATTSVSTVAADQAFTLYPNPAANTINFKGLSSAHDASYTIYDVLGNVNATGSLTENMTSVNVSSLPPGIYFAKLHSDQKESTLRFVIEK
jgi:hypothetical protein